MRKNNKNDNKNYLFHHQKNVKNRFKKRKGVQERGNFN